MVNLDSRMSYNHDRHAEMVLKSGNIDPEKVRKIKYLHEFDREIQGPTWGYPTEGAYYRDASSVDSILNIRVPVFAINAEDDPVSGDPLVLTDHGTP